MGGTSSGGQPNRCDMNNRLTLLAPASLSSQVLTGANQNKQEEFDHVREI